MVCPDPLPVRLAANYYTTDTVYTTFEIYCNLTQEYVEKFTKGFVRNYKMYMIHPLRLICVLCVDQILKMLMVIASIFKYPCGENVLNMVLSVTSGLFESKLGWNFSLEVLYIFCLFNVEWKSIIVTRHFIT